MNDTPTVPTADTVVSQTLLFYVNGKKIEELNPDPEWTLLWYLRKKLGLVGSKLGCGEGGCGACTVMLSKLVDGQVRHFSVNACLSPVVTLHGTAVTTVEALGSAPDRLHPIQERLAKAHGSQCGFCTPGFVMSAYALLRSQPTLPSLEQLEDALVGNLCRCTGYRPILEGLRTLTSDGQASCGRLNCCRDKNKNNNNCCLVNGENNGAPGDLEMVEELFDVTSCAAYDPTQEIIFPPELQLNPDFARVNLSFRGPRVQFQQVTRLEDLLQVKHESPNAKIIIGNTEIGVEVRMKDQLYTHLVSVSGVQEMEQMEVQEDGVRIGAAVTLSTVQEKLKNIVSTLPAYKTRVLAAILEMLKWFAGKQIRNVACLGGNIMTSSPISDLNPLLLASCSLLHLHSVTGGVRTRVMDGSFFTGYRKCDVTPSEVLVAVTVPFTAQNEYFQGFKQARRRDDDIAIANAGLRVSLEDDVVTSVTLAFGGVAPKTVLASVTMQLMKGRKWNDELLQDVTSSLVEELEVTPSAPGGMTAYRTTLLPSFFFKFYLHVRHELSKTLPTIPPLAPYQQEVLRPLTRPAYSATHLYEKVPADQPAMDPIGRPLVHASARQQVTGEATYVDDVPQYSNELFGAFVLSTQAKAQIVSLDAEEALALPGVHAVVSAKDLPGKRNITGMVQDEEVFASTSVQYVGQPVCLVVADDEHTARCAAKLVKVQYKVDGKPIITLEEAIAAKSYLHEMSLHSGDVAAAHAAADHTLEGEVHVGGQEHFYMEPNTHLAVPGECNSMTVFSCTQSPSDAQSRIASALGVPANQVTVRVKRLGGGFGGKETRSILASAPAAVAANVTGRPVRVVLERAEDMLMTGTRHPFFAKWRVSFNKQGVLQAVEMDLYSNAGFSLDLSYAVMDRALTSMDNAYYCANTRATGHVCRTNLPSNTAFRGFGTPQAMFVREDIMARVAAFLDLDAVQVREVNMYKDGDVTPYGEKLENCNMRRCWQDVKEQALYYNRKALVDEFNSTHVYQKRGIAIIPTKYGVAFGIKFLSQGGALVMVYKDGSVLLTHGGIEMGQGLHTKMIQVASRVLEIPAERIHISETATDKIPNMSATAASMSSDLYGEAVLRACIKLRDHLAPYRKQNPDGGWNNWVMNAYLDRVQLSATGFYAPPNMYPYDYETQAGRPFFYHSFGAAASEVQVDCLTGDFTVLRTDIVMDLGKSLNPAVDIGQVEGGFLQGQGLFTLEELRYTPEGSLLTRGPGTYKMPGIQDIPCELNVTLLRESGNPKAVYSSKAIGEPPLFLAASVYHAIREAITAARCDPRLLQCGELGPAETRGTNHNNDTDSKAATPGPSLNTEEAASARLFRLDSPATAERIRMACIDRITKMVRIPQPGTYKPWDVTV
ncbi:Xanthine dehydrogenase small subunit [Trinorchestia longiramus]|nr:Xanthine dehydrogenase small subunit [Trinorchestia longiramus]